MLLLILGAVWDCFPMQNKVKLASGETAALERNLAEEWALSLEQGFLGRMWTAWHSVSTDEGRHLSHCQTLSNYFD